MPEPIAVGLSLAAAALGTGITVRVRGAGRARAAARAAYLDACLPLFERAERRLEPTGFPRLTGNWHGRPFDLRALPDTLTFRKLPALWLMVTLPAPMPVGATLDILRRPTGGEVFSAFDRLPVAIAPPPGLPADAALHTDDPTGLPPEELLAPHLPALSDDRAKELVISPRGLRLVWLAEEADRSRYLLFRDAEMGQAPLAPGVVTPLLARLAALAADLDLAATARRDAAA
jgi:hypothetical protein